MNIQKKALLSMALVAHLVATAAVEPQGTITAGTAATWADTTGDYIKSTGVTITDAAAISGVATLQATTIDANTQGTFVGDNLSKTDVAVVAATALVESATSEAVINTLVLRDEVGDCAANIITGTTDPGVNASNFQAATKAYLAYANATLLVKEPVVAMALADTPTSDIPANLDGVTTLVTGSRVLLNNQTDQRQNGIWEVNTGAWTRPTDFNTGAPARGAYVLVTGGSERKGSAWKCLSDPSIIDTNEIVFTPQSQPGQIIGENFGIIEQDNYGAFYADKTGSLLDLRSIKGGDNIYTTSNATDVTISMSHMIQLSDGSAANPSIFFTSNPDTGLYRDPSTESLVFDINGSAVVMVNTFTTQVNANIIMPSPKDVYYDLGAEQVYMYSTLTGHDNSGYVWDVTVNVNTPSYCEYIIPQHPTTGYYWGRINVAPATVTYPIQKTIVYRYYDNGLMNRTGAGNNDCHASIYNTTYADYVWTQTPANRAVVFIITWLPGAGRNPYVQYLPLN